jgi:hypothetical protein
MIRLSHLRACLLVTILCLGGAGCLRRPHTAQSRMIEPELIEPQQAAPAGPVTKAADAIAIRLLETQARGNIGRRVLHQQPNGELSSDAVWRWSTSPERYLDTALRQAVTASPNVLSVDTGSAPTLGAVLLEWDLESAGGMRLVGSVEFQVTSEDRTVQTKVVRSSEPVSEQLPGDLAAAAGRLLHRLASEGLGLAAGKPPAPSTSQR